MELVCGIAMPPCDDALAAVVLRDTGPAGLFGLSIFDGIMCGPVLRRHLIKLMKAIAEGTFLPKTEELQLLYSGFVRGQLTSERTFESNS